jgi:hypothetical protein
MILIFLFFGEFHILDDKVKQRMWNYLGKIIILGSVNSIKKTKTIRSCTLCLGTFFKGDALLNIRCKGPRISKKVLVPKEAVLHVNNYLADETKEANDPLNQSRW